MPDATPNVEGQVITLPTDPKMWYLSMELWTAIVAIGFFILQGLGTIVVPVDGTVQASFVVVILALLRGFRTKSPIAWMKKQLHAHA